MVKNSEEAGARRLWPWLVGLSAAVAGAGAVAVVLAVIAIAVVVIVVLAVLAAIVFFLVYLVTSPLSQGPAFVDALAADNDRAAYDLLCEETRAVVPFERFQTRIAPEPEVVDTTIETEGGGLFGPPTRTLATFHFAGGGSTTVVYEAEPGPDGNLYVCGPPSFPGQ